MEPESPKLLRKQIRQIKAYGEEKPGTRFRVRLAAYAARILIPQQTTTTATMMQVAVSAFSKADEAIVMLSFAYPEETLGDSAAIPQLGKDRYQQPAGSRIRKGTNTFLPTLPWEL